MVNNSYIGMAGVCGDSLWTLLETLWSRQPKNDSLLSWARSSKVSLWITKEFNIFSMYEVVHKDW